MNITNKIFDKNIHILRIDGIANNGISGACISKILKMLTFKDTYYCEFTRENFFLDEKDVLKLREKVPKFIENNGSYYVKERRDDSCFTSICKLRLSENVYEYMPYIWNYFEEVMLLTPTANLKWEIFDEHYNTIKPDLYGLGYMKKGYADSIFIKGHDGCDLFYIYSDSNHSSSLAGSLKCIENMQPFC